MQSDPIGLAGGINTYTYVRENPLTRIDPFGLCDSSPTGPYQRSSPQCDNTPLPKEPGLTPVCIECIFIPIARVAKTIYDVCKSDPVPSPHPSTPTGQSGSPMDISNGTNSPGNINGRNYSGHAFDEMQSDGIPPSVVSNTIGNGVQVAGKRPGTTAYYDQINNITVVTNSSNGTVITVSRGRISQ